MRLCYRLCILPWMICCGINRCAAYLSPGRTLTQRRVVLCQHGMESKSSETFTEPSVLKTSTRYTIDTPPIDPELLRATVWKNFANFDRYLDSRPVAAHTQEAFEQFQQELSKSSESTSNGLILDSCCGTGRSSLVLGRMYPEKTIVGVDRSIDRLGRVARDLSSGTEIANQQEEHCTERQHVQRVEENVILVRAELVHFWRLWWQHGLVADQHYILYPNPYPKKSRLKQRWYAHPSFPLLLTISVGNPMILRSNWKQYLQEFADAVIYASEYHETDSTLSEGETIPNTTKYAAAASQIAKTYAKSAQHGPQVRSPGDAWTNFEAKYDKIGEATYQLAL